MTDLTDRMRTCAAHMAQEDFAAWRIYTSETQDQLVKDAAELLLLAADELEKPIEVRLGEPMAVIEAVQVIESLPTIPKNYSGPVWTDPCTALPTVPLSKNACPKCDSRATKTVRTGKGRISLECPVCGHIWWR